MGSCTEGALYSGEDVGRWLSRLTQSKGRGIEGLGKEKMNVGFRERENARDSEHSLIWQPDPEYEGACRRGHFSFLPVDRIGM